MNNLFKRNKQWINLKKERYLGFLINYNLFPFVPWKLVQKQNDLVLVSFIEGIMFLKLFLLFQKIVTYFAVLSWYY